MHGISKRRLSTFSFKIKSVSKYSQDIIKRVTKGASPIDESETLMLQVDTITGGFLNINTPIQETPQHTTWH